MRLIKIAESANAIYLDETWLDLRDKKRVESEYLKLFSGAKEKVVIIAGKIYRSLCDSPGFIEVWSKKLKEGVKIDVPAHLVHSSGIELMIIDSENIFLADKNTGTILIARNKHLCNLYLNDIYGLN